MLRKLPRARHAGVHRAVAAAALLVAGLAGKLVRRAAGHGAGLQLLELLDARLVLRPEHAAARPEQQLVLGARRRREPFQGLAAAVDDQPPPREVDRDDHGHLAVRVGARVEAPEAGRALQRERRVPRGPAMQAELAQWQFAQHAFLLRLCGQRVVSLRVLVGGVLLRLLPPLGVGGGFHAIAHAAAADRAAEGHDA